MAKLKLGTTIGGATAWHAGNDGTGSGLSADNLQGYTPQESAAANSIAKRNGDGDLTVTDLLADGVVSSDGLKIYNGTTQVGELTTTDTTWFRLNQNIDKNIYTPRYIRADNGFFVDGSTYGINGSGNGVFNTSVTVGGTAVSLEGHTHSYDNYGSWTLQALNSAGTSLGSSTITSGDTANIKAGSNITLSWADDQITITGVGDTNNYLTGVSGSGDGTVTFTRSGLGNLTWDASHTHSTGNINYFDGNDLTNVNFAQYDGDLNDALSALDAGFTNTEWFYVGTATDASTNNAIVVNNLDLVNSQAFDFGFYDYKFVYDGYTSVEDNSAPYIVLDGDNTSGRYSYIYHGAYMSSSTGETTNLVGSADTAANIQTGVFAGSYSTGQFTQVHIEFTISRIWTTYSGMYFYSVEGMGHANTGFTTSTPVTTSSGTNSTHFSGGYSPQAATSSLSNVYFYHNITAGSDVNKMRVYKRKKQ